MPIDIEALLMDAGRKFRGETDILPLLLRHNRVEQPLFDALLQRHDARWLVELAATIGQYQYISAINNTFDLQPPPDADQLPV